MARLLKRRSVSSRHVYSHVPYIAALQICSALTQSWSGGGKRGLVLSYPVHCIVFIIAEANGKEASISSDVEDSRFAAQIGLG